MCQNEQYHGGLVFFGGSGPELDGFCRVVASTMEDYGYLVDRQSILSDGQARITSGRLAVSLQLITAAGAPRLVLTLATAGRSVVEPNQAQLVLLVMLHRIIEGYTAKSVEWLDPTVVLPAGQFMNAFAKVSPRRIRGRQEILDADNGRFTPVHEAEQTISCRYDEIQGQPVFAKEGPVDLNDQEALAMAFRTGPHPEEIDGTETPQKAENDIRRLAAWGMTGVVTCLSGPVGLSMAAVNLARGEDFRLNTHVLALTAFLGVSTSTGAMAQVLSVLPI